MAKKWGKTVVGLAFCLLLAVGIAWAQTEADKAQCLALNEQLSQLHKAGKYNAAAQVGEELVKRAEQAFGPEAPKYATCLNNLATLYRDMGRFDRAEALHKQALEIRRKILGENHLVSCPGNTLTISRNHVAQPPPAVPRMGGSRAAHTTATYARYFRDSTLDYGISLNNLAALYWDMGDYAQAEPLYKKASDIFLKVLGENHPYYAQSLNNLAALYSDKGDYAKAEPLLKQAMEIRRKALGENHPNYAGSLNNLAGLYHDMGDYGRAEALFKQASEIFRKTLGESHPSYATSLNNLGGLYKGMGDYARAAAMYKQGLEITRKALGENHPDYAGSLNNLAAVYHDTGDYAIAEALYKQALEIDRKTLGEDKPSYARDLNNLAQLYSQMGDYARAEPLYKQASEIWRKALGENHPDYARTLNNLAALYQHRADYPRAETLFKKASEIWRKAVGENHPDYALTLNNLATLYDEMGDYARAEALDKRSLEIRRKVLGENHPSYAQSLNNLALVYQHMGDYARAEPLCKKASEVWRKVVGENHPDYATSLNNLAGLYQAKGDYARAEGLYEQAIEIFRKAVGQNHPLYSQTVNNLAVLYAAWDKPGEALQCFNKDMKSLHAHTLTVLAGLSQERKLDFLRYVWSRLECYLSFVLSYPNAPGSIVGGAMWLARWKALSAEVQTEQYRLLRLAKDAETRKLLDDLESARRELARWTLSPPAKMSFEDVRQRREESEKKVSELEEAVGKRSLEFAELRRIGSADLAQIAQSLPADAVLIDFARFRQCNFKAKGNEPRWGEYRYLAFTTHPSSFIPHQSVLIDLGPARPIDDAVAAFRAAIENPTNESPLTNHVSRITKPLKTLSNLVLCPILQHVKGRDHLILCPDGQLSLVPFECLLTDDRKYLIESFQISYLGAGREAVAYGGHDVVGATRASPLLVGDPDFDLRVVLAPSGGQMAPLAPPVLPITRASRDLGAARFDRLPGTRMETELAGKMLQGNLLLDREAVEGAVKRASRPDVLYLATHGFFLPDQEIPRDNALGTPRGVMIGEEGPRTPKGRIENPLLRCGLAFAGANHRDSVPPESGADDGILTGMEVAGLDLRGTKLVVLSACETGIGDVKQGEGVMGLRRAFLLAGARRVLSTLWKVPDQQTQELMTDFVKRWQSGTPAVKALRDAQLATIERLRKERGEAHPFFWAAFTMTGDWR